MSFRSQQLWARALSMGFFLFAAHATLAVRSAQADTTEAVQQEARQRFDRGLRLFNQQDNEGALAEFQRVYELSPHPLVRYNIGLVFAAMNRPVEAVDVFDALLTHSEGLDAARLAHLREQREQQAQRIGEIVIQGAVEGARVELDGLEVGRIPLTAPLRTASGVHVVGLVATGFAPARKQVIVPGQTKVEVAFELSPLEGQPAHVVVQTRLVDCEVLVDGLPVGKTPLEASLALSPGTRTIELRRPGYRAARQSLTLGPASSGTVALEPELDTAALGSEGGVLELVLSEPDAVVAIDGQHPRSYTGPLSLPHGTHVVRVERAGFYPSERKVTLPRGGSSHVVIDLTPTPEQRAAYRSRTVAQRTWGYISLGAGAALAAGGVTFLLINSGEESDKKDAFDVQAARNGPGGDCDREAGRQTPSCVRTLNLALEDLKEVRAREKFGWIGAGVGAAGMGLGIVLLWINDDPNRYEPRPESDIFGRLELRPTAWFDADGGGLSITGILP